MVNPPSDVGIVENPVLIELKKIVLLGASLPWRIAIGLFLISPFLSFAILCFSPKSPVWLISCGKEKEGLESLTLIRGEENKDLIDSEFTQIKYNLTTNHNTSLTSKMRQSIEVLTDSTFLKPFGILLLVFPIGMSWSGLITIGFYMVPLLEKAQISMNPYWANAIIQTIRAIASILGIFFNKNLKRRPVYIGCCILSCTGTLTLALYYFFNQSDELSNTWMASTPIISVLLVYVAYGLGLGSIPIMLQVDKYVYKIQQNSARPRETQRDSARPSETH